MSWKRREPKVLKRKRKSMKIHLNRVAVRRNGEPILKKKLDDQGDEDTPKGDPMTVGELIFRAIEEAPTPPNNTAVKVYRERNKFLDRLDGCEDDGQIDVDVTEVDMIEECVAKYFQARIAVPLLKQIHWESPKLEKVEGGGD